MESCAGATAKHEASARLGLAVVADTRKGTHRRDSGRIQTAEGRIKEQHKKYKAARRQAKTRDEEQWRRELTVVTEPASKRTKK